MRTSEKGGINLMAVIELYNNYINAEQTYKVALKVLQNASNSDDVFMRIQGNTDGYPFSYNYDSSETYRDLPLLHSSLDIMMFNSVLFNTDRIMYMERMFENDKNVGGNFRWTPINVRTMANAFRNSGITAIPITIRAENLNNVSNTFRDCKSLICIPSINFYNQQNEVNASFVFYNVSEITSLPNMNFVNCVNGIDMSYAFAECYKMRGDIFTELCSGHGWNYVRNYSHTFENCRNIYGDFQNALTVGNSPFFYCDDTSYMFANCTLLATMGYIQVNNYYNHNIEGMYFNCRTLMFTPYIMNTLQENTLPTHMANTFRNCIGISGTVFLPQRLKDDGATSFSSRPRSINLCGTFANCKNLEGVAIAGRNTIFDIETFEGWHDQKIWVYDRNDFRVLISGAYGLNFSYRNNSSGSETFHYNNGFTQQQESISLPYTHWAQDEVNNVNLFCYEAELSDPDPVNKIVFYELANNYLHNASSQWNQWDINQMIKNITFENFNFS